MRPLSRDPETGRDLFLLELSAPGELPSELLPRHFACLLAWDSRAASVDEISAVVTDLMNAGAVYFVCWGPGCERVADIVSEIDSNPFDSVGAVEGSVVMTAWLPGDPLEEALWRLLNTSEPHEPYGESTRASLAISIGSGEWAATLRAALEQPRRFSSRLAEEEDPD